ncbi:MAG: 50S ribosomal protein L32 [Candidatus Lindowbacteria bacterium]|nr:50S ribosomal protein L32 [Candidatus Lindowbacteria bacterium]
MALPKRRQSKARSRKRRTGKGLPAPTLNRCSECGVMIQPHTACSKCGAYKGKRQVIKVSNQD